MEREFLSGVDFNLYVDKSNYEAWLKFLKGLVTAKEEAYRKWAHGTRGRSERRRKRVPAMPPAPSGHGAHHRVYAPQAPARTFSSSSSHAFDAPVVQAPTVVAPAVVLVVARVVVAEALATRISGYSLPPPMPTAYLSIQQQFVFLPLSSRRAMKDSDA